MRYAVNNILTSEIHVSQKMNRLFLYPSPVVFGLLMNIEMTILKTICTDDNNDPKRY